MKGKPIIWIGVLIALSAAFAQSKINPGAPSSASELEGLKQQMNVLKGEIESLRKTSRKGGPLPQSSFPLGTIIAWSPIEIDNVGRPTGRSRPKPDGWEVCDGTNGTPDLKERFLMGVVAHSDAGKTGGSNSIVPDGKHSHGGRTEFAEETGNPKVDGRDGKHTHRHDHAIQQESNHNHGGDKRPSYYTVVYLMKIAN